MRKNLLRSFSYFLIYSFFWCGYTDATASDDSKFTNIMIVYSGDIRGNIEPTGCCTKLGGISRIGTVIQNFKKENQNVIILDTGDFLWNLKKEPFYSIETKTMCLSLEKLPYDAINIADGEIMSGAEFLSTLDNNSSLPLISMNVTISENTNIKLKPYIIKEFNSIKLAIIGLTSPELLSEKPIFGFSIADPIDTLKQHIQEIRKQADMIILLSHLGWDNIKSLLEQVSDIDIAISGHDTYPTFEPEKFGKTLMLKNALGGGLLGIIRLGFDYQTKKVETINSDFIMIEQKITPLPEFAKIESDFIEQKIRLREELQQAEIQKQLNEEMNALMKMTPEEFMKYNREKQSRQSNIILKQ